MSGLKPFRSAAVTPGPRVTARAPSPWSWAWAGAALGLAVSLTLNAPARWLTNVLQQATQGRLVFQDPRGTLWNGSAQLVLTGGVGSTDSAALPGRFTWQLHPSVSGLQADAQADCCMQAPLRLSLTPRWGGAQLVLADSLSRWPAQWLTGLGTPWNTVQPEGNLTLATRALTLDWAAGRLLLAGSAQLDAAQISSRLSTLRPMGSYRIVLAGGPVPSFEMSTLDGSLQLSGRGQWVGSRFSFEGVASAAPERLEALSNLLNIIGRRDGARAIIKLG